MTTEKEQVYDSPSQALNDHGIFVLMDDIDPESIKPVIEWILHENHVKKKKHKELLLMVCSNGGNISEAFALIDVMRSSKIPVKTVGLGCIASCGLLIFLAGVGWLVFGWCWLLVWRWLLLACCWLLFVCCCLLLVLGGWLVWLAGWLVRWFVGWLAGWLVGWLVVCCCWLAVGGCFCS